MVYYFFFFSKVVKHDRGDIKGIFMFITLISFLEMFNGDVKNSENWQKFCCYCLLMMTFKTGRFLPLKCESKVNQEYNWTQ